MNTNDDWEAQQEFKRLEPLEIEMDEDTPDYYGFEEDILDEE